MPYFKHSALSDTYHVSLKTVHNWIDAAKQGKVNLKLYEAKNGTYIANTSENVLILKQLSDRGKKYRNTLHHKIVEPKSEFYQIYDRRQILDIITNLKVHGEIPRQYNYLEGGATNWDNWLKRLASEESSNILKATIDLVRANLPIIGQLLEGNKKVNVIDLGAGNAYPVKELLGYLIDRKLLNRYVAIDISPAMLTIAENNVKEWYGENVNFEGYVRDISYEHFDDLLVDDMLGTQSDETVNLILLFGLTASNLKSFGDVFKVAYSSIGANDLLMYADKPDTEAARRYFDFNPAPGMSKLSPSHKYILDLMNVDESLYDVEMGFDDNKMMRYIRVRMKTAITIKYSFGSIDRRVDFEKGDTILLLRVWHRSTLATLSLFEKIGFRLLQSSLTKDKQYFLSISGVEGKPSVEAQS